MGAPKITKKSAAINAKDSKKQSGKTLVLNRSKTGMLPRDGNQGDSPRSSRSQGINAPYQTSQGSGATGGKKTDYGPPPFDSDHIEPWMEKTDPSLGRSRPVEDSKPAPSVNTSAELSDTPNQPTTTENHKESNQTFVKNLLDSEEQHLKIPGRDRHDPNAADLNIQSIEDISNPDEMFQKKSVGPIAKRGPILRQRGVDLKDKHLTTLDLSSRTRNKNSEISEDQNTNMKNPFENSLPDIEPPKAVDPMKASSTSQNKNIENEEIGIKLDSTAPEIKIPPSNEVDGASGILTFESSQPESKSPETTSQNSTGEIKLDVSLSEIQAPPPKMEIPKNTIESKSLNTSPEIPIINPSISHDTGTSIGGSLTQALVNPPPFKKMIHLDPLDLEDVITALKNIKSPSEVRTLMHRFCASKFESFGVFSLNKIQINGTFGYGDPNWVMNFPTLALDLRLPSMCRSVVTTERPYLGRGGTGEGDAILYRSLDIEKPEFCVVFPIKRKNRIKLLIVGTMSQEDSVSFNFEEIKNFANYLDMMETEISGGKQSY